MRVLFVLLASILLSAPQLYAVAQSPHDRARSSSEAAKSTSEVSIPKEKSDAFGDPLNAPGVHDVKQDVNQVTGEQGQQKIPSASAAPGVESAPGSGIESSSNVGRDSRDAVERDKRRKQNWDDVDQQRRQRAEEIEQEKRED